MRLTATDAVRRLPRGTGRVLLHGARDDDGLAERSLVASMPHQVFSVRDARWEVRDAAGALLSAGAGDPLGALGDFVESATSGATRHLPAGERTTTEAPLVMGYLGYELGHFVEGLRSAHDSLPEVPTAWLGIYDAFYVFDERSGEGHIEGVDVAARERLAAALGGSPSAGPPPALGALVDDWSRAAYEARVERVLEYIGAGDVYQVNLARRLVAEVLEWGDPLAIYDAIARHSPAPLGAYLEAGEVAVISGSPELFLRRRTGERRLETRPIKGTRRREVGDDGRLGQELLADPKERAEHLMIVDLERNDLGRVATLGSVSVDRFAYVIELPTLYHLVSTVSCDLREGTGLAEILRATFPGGSITGAPKVRAMQVIDELESAPRGPYTGAIGAFGPGGAMTLSIAIRTATVTRSSLMLHVGGGIVADSRPEREYEETEEKAAAWRRALSALQPALAGVPADGEATAFAEPRER